MKDFIAELEKLDSDDLDYTDMIKQYLHKNKIDKTVSDYLKNIIGIHNDKIK